MDDYEKHIVDREAKNIPKKIKKKMMRQGRYPG